MAKLVTGLFNTRSSAMLAVEDLMRHGFAQDDLSLLNTDTNLGREFFADVTSKAPKGAAWGTVVGMIIGGIVAALMHLGYLRDFGSQLGPLSTVLAVLVGMGAVGLAGLIIGAIIGSTIPAYEMNFYRADQRHGGILLGVYSHERRQGEVCRLLEAAGGRHLATKNVRDETLPDRPRAFSNMSDREAQR